MKKWINRLSVIMAAGILTVALAACASSDGGNNAGTPSTEPQSISDQAENNESDPAQEAQAANAEAADTSDLKKLNIGFPSSGGSWPGGLLGVAIVEGYLEEYLNPLGYTADPQGFVGAAPAIHEALVSKDLDYVAYAGMAGVLGKANQIDTTLLAITSYTSGWRLIASADSGIESIDDLEGKSIAYTRGAAPQQYLLKILAEAGIDFEDVEGVNMTIPDGLAAVATGSIDAAVVTAGQDTELVESGTAVVLHKGFEADPDLYYETMVLIGRTELVEAEEEVGVALIKALLKAKDKIAEDPDAYYELSAEQSGNPLEVVLATASYDTEAAFPILLADKYINSLKDTEVFLTDNELISGTVDFDSWVNASLLEKALEAYDSEK